jgi:hypothetical protein
MTMMNAYYEHENDTIECLVEEGIDPDDIQLARLFTEVLWTFHWGRDGEEAQGTVGLTVEDGTLHLELETWVADSDSLDDTIKPLSFSVPVDRFRSPADQIRAIVHAHLCHEADERLWFDVARPYHPHAEVTA